MSAARPPDFEPLASTDPVRGDPDEIAMLGRRYADTAAEIARQAANLRKLATAGSGGWKGQAGAVFHTHAADLATRISKAHDRYAAAGSALRGCAAPMGDAQQRAYSAVWQAKSAQQQMNANAPGPPRPPGSPPLTDQQKAQDRVRQAAYDDAQTALSQARRSFDAAVGDYHSVASRAARQITMAIDRDGLKDSWWDHNFGWISTVFKIIAVVILVLAVVALILMLPVGAGLLALLATYGITAEGITAALILGTVAELAFDGTAAATHKESWTAAALDVVALATFGIGEGVAYGVRLIADDAAITGAAVAAARAGRTAMGGGLRGLFFSAGIRSNVVFRLLGAGDRLDVAVKAAASARSELATAVKEAKPETLRILLTWPTKQEVAANLGKLDVVNSRVPHVLRIMIPRIAANGLAGINGVTQWSGFGANSGYTVWGWLHNDEARTQAGIDQAVTRVRRSLSAVP